MIGAYRADTSMISAYISQLSKMSLSVPVVPMSTMEAFERVLLWSGGRFAEICPTIHQAIKSALVR